MVLAAFCIFVASVGVYTAFGVFFKPMLNDFGWSKAMTSGAFSLSWVVNGLLGIAVGRLNDRFGSRGVITLSGLFLGLGYVLMSQVSSLWQLYLFYGIIIGAGMGGIWVPIMSTIARSFVAKRGVVTAIVMVGGGTGALIAPPVANWLITKLHWRTSYLLLGMVVMGVVVVSAQFLKTVRPQEEKPSGLPGTEASMSFCLTEALCTRQFWLCTWMVFCFGFCAYIIMVHIVPHATELGISAAGAANILAVIGGVATLGRMVLGGSADRIGNRQVFMIGFAAIVAGLFWLLRSGEAWELYLFSVLFGFGFGAGVSNSPLVAELFGVGSHGLILGVNVLGYSMGAAAGPLLAGYLFDITGSYRAAFYVCALAGALGLLLTALIKQVRREEFVLK